MLASSGASAGPAHYVGNDPNELNRERVRNDRLREEQRGGPFGGFRRHASIEFDIQAPPGSGVRRQRQPRPDLPIAPPTQPHQPLPAVASRQTYFRFCGYCKADMGPADNQPGLPPPTICLNCGEPRDPIPAQSTAAQAPFPIQVPAPLPVQAPAPLPVQVPLQAQASIPGYFPSRLPLSELEQELELLREARQRRMIHQLREKLLLDEIAEWDTLRDHRSATRDARSCRGSNLKRERSPTEDRSLWEEPVARRPRRDHSQLPAGGIPVYRGPFRGFNPHSVQPQAVPSGVTPTSTNLDPQVKVQKRKKPNREQRRANRAAKEAEAKVEEVNAEQAKAEEVKAETAKEIKMEANEADIKEEGEEQGRDTRNLLDFQVAHHNLRERMRRDSDLQSRERLQGYSVQRDIERTFRALMQDSPRGSSRHMYFTAQAASHSELADCLLQHERELRSICDNAEFRLSQVHDSASIDTFTTSYEDELKSHRERLLDAQLAVISTRDAILQQSSALLSEPLSLMDSQQQPQVPVDEGRMLTDTPHQEPSMIGLQQQQQVPMDEGRIVEVSSRESSPDSAAAATAAYLNGPAAED